MDALRWLLDAEILVSGSPVLLREILGNVFGLACALGGMLRRVWAWPVGIAGNLLLLTVFLGSFLGLSDDPALLGQAGRQLMFLLVSIYGWHRWHSARRSRRAWCASGAVAPRWASPRARLGLVAVLVLGTAALTPVLRALGSYEPVWADAWTFVGSLLATYGMARGWVEFWLIWIAVDVVGVPLLWAAGYYASAGMYAVYGVFTLIGFIVWNRARRHEAIGTPSSLAPAADDLAARVPSVPAPEVAQSTPRASRRGRSRTQEVPLDG